MISLDVLSKESTHVVDPHEPSVQRSRAAQHRERYLGADSSAHNRIVLDELPRADSRSNEEHNEPESEEIVGGASDVVHVESRIKNVLERLRRRVFRCADPVCSELDFSRRAEIAELRVSELVDEDVRRLDK